MNELMEALRPVTRRLRGLRAGQGMAWGVLAGAGVALLLAALSFAWPLPWVWMPACVAAGALIGAAIGGAWPLAPEAAARAADACGLRERAITALEAGDSPAGELVRADACRALRGLDPRSIRGKPVKKRLLAALGAAALAAGLIMLPHPAKEPAETLPPETLRQLAEASAALEAAAEREAAGLSEPEREELRRWTSELTRAAANPRDLSQLMDAMTQGAERLEALESRLAAERESAQSAGTVGQNASGEGNQGEGSPGEGNEAAGTHMAGTQSEGTQTEQTQAEEAQGNSDGGEKSGEQTSAEKEQQGSQTGSALPQTAAAFQAMQAAAQMAASQASASGNSNPAGAGGPNGQGQSQSAGSSDPQGQGNQAGQGAGDAGTGSTNEAQSGTGGQTSTGMGRGQQDPRYQESAYESIYDPTRIGAEERAERTNLNANGEDAVEVDAGLGAGTLEGYLPYSQVIGEYAAGAALAADSVELTPEERAWVDTYFAELTK